MKKTAAPMTMPPITTIGIIPHMLFVLLDHPVWFALMTLEIATGTMAAIMSIAMLNVTIALESKPISKGGTDSYYLCVVYTH